MATQVASWVVGQGEAVCVQEGSNVRVCRLATDQESWELIVNAARPLGDLFAPATDSVLLVWGTHRSGAPSSRLLLAPAVADRLEEALEGASV